MGQITVGFLIAIIFMAGFMTYVITHEATHLALSNEPYGICLGRCRYNSNQKIEKTGIAFATAIGQHNIHSIQETIPTITGILAMFWIILIGMISLETIQKKEAEPKEEKVNDT